MNKKRKLVSPAPMNRREAEATLGDQAGYPL